MPYLASSATRWVRSPLCRCMPLYAARYAAVCRSVCRWAQFGSQSLQYQLRTRPPRASHPARPAILAPLPAPNSGTPPPLSGAGVLIQGQLPGEGGGGDLVTPRQQIVCLYTEAGTQASPPVTHGFRTSRWVADVALMSIFMSLFCCAFLTLSWWRIIGTRVCACPLVTVQCKAK